MFETNQELFQFMKLYRKCWIWSHDCWMFSQHSAGHANLRTLFINFGKHYSISPASRLMVAGSSPAVVNTFFDQPQIEGEKGQPQVMPIQPLQIRRSLLKR